MCQLLSKDVNVLSTVQKNARGAGARVVVAMGAESEITRTFASVDPALSLRTVRLLCAHENSGAEIRCSP